MRLMLACDSGFDRKDVSATPDNVVDDPPAVGVNVLKHGHGQNQIELLVRKPIDLILLGPHVDRYALELRMVDTHELYLVGADSDAHQVLVAVVVKVGEVAADVAPNLEGFTSVGEIRIQREQQLTAPQYLGSPPKHSRPGTAASKNHGESPLNTSGAPYVAVGPP